MFVLKSTTTTPTTGGGKSQQPVCGKQPKCQITDDKKRTLLVGYVVVPSDAWETIPYKSHIRYIKVDGTFVRGGFFKNLWTTQDGVHMMQLENNLNRKAPGYTTWAVAFNNIRVLYKKVDKSNIIEVSSMYKKIEQQRTAINSLVDAVNELDRRVKVLENRT